MVSKRPVLANFQKIVLRQRLWELLPVFLVVFLLPFLHGGETEFARVIFFAFPIFYLPILFWKKRKVGKNFNFIFWLWIVYLASNLMSAVFSMSLALSVSELMERLGVFVYFGFFYLIIEKKSDLDLMANLIVTVGFALSLISFYLIVWPPPPSFPHMNLVYATLGKNNLVGYLLFVMPICITRFLRAIKLKRRFFWGLATIFFTVAFMLTFSRGGYVILSWLVMAIYFLYKPKGNKLVMLVPLVVIPTIAVVGLVLFSQIKNVRGGIKPEAVWRSWLLKQTYKPPTQELRFGYWQQAIKGLRLQPMLGNGPGTFRLIARRFANTPKPTTLFALNFLLQALAEVGVIGFIVLILLLGGVFYQLQQRHFFSPTTYTPLLLGIFASFLFSLIDYNFEFLSIYVLFWVLIAAGLAQDKIGRKPLGKLVKIILILSAIFLFIFSAAKATGKFLIYKANGTRLKLNSSQAYNDYQKSVSIAPFDRQNWLTALQAWGTPAPPQSFIKRAIYFNRQDYKVLSSIQRLGGNEAVPADKIFFKLVELDPQNKASYCRVLLHKSQNGLRPELAIDCLVDIAKSSTELASFTTDGWLDSVDDKLLQAFGQYFVEVDLANQSYSQLALAKNFYFLGLKAFQNKLTNITEQFWLMATLLAPEWSFFHLELANLYALQGKSLQANKELNRCLRYWGGKQHCQNLLIFLTDGKDYPGVGSWEKEISEIEPKAY